MVTTNEGRCCDAVLRILEEQHGSQRRNLGRDTPERPSIDVECTIGDQHYALEHTLIEPFSDNQRDNINFERVFDRAFEAAVLDLMSSHLAYTISVEIYAFQGMDTKSLTSARTALLTWVRGALPKLPEPQLSGHPQEVRVRGEPPEAPVRVTLACHHSSLSGGKLLPGRFAPANLDHLRRARLLRALKDKGPKLLAARRIDTRTVLVVENHDIAITNESTVAEAFGELAAQAEYMPDDIYMVNTGSPPCFYVTQIRRAGRTCVKMGSKPNDWKFEAGALTDI